MEIAPEANFPCLRPHDRHLKKLERPFALRFRSGGTFCSCSPRWLGQPGFLPRALVFYASPACGRAFSFFAALRPIPLKSPTTITALRFSASSTIALEILWHRSSIRRLLPAYPIDHFQQFLFSKPLSEPRNDASLPLLPSRRAWGR